MKQLLLTSFTCTLLATLAAAQIKGFKFAIGTLGGQEFDQSDFTNNIVIVDFWGTWCGPCKRSIPGLVDLYKKYKHHGLEIIGLNYKESGTKEQQRETVRKFAQRHGITYTLALGTPGIRKQVIGFSGYPTMLFFKKGMKFDHLEVGFAPEHAAAMEKWVRAELGLDGDAPEPGTLKPGKAGEEETIEEEEQPEPKMVKVPAGVIYRPGNHDTGFEFEVVGTDGKKVRFKDYHGKKVILALTSTWDHEAANTAAILADLHAKYSNKGIVILAASLEMKKDRKSRVAAINAFAKKHTTTWVILPVGLDFLKKIHEPSGLPMFLVFDEKGTLILRRKNNSKQRILDAITGAIGS